jgi:hypothetical protein
MYWFDDVSFIAHPNTGSRSLMKMILRYPEGKCINDQHGICLDTIKKSRAVVCVIRNPYDMMASWYWRMVSKPDFNDWLRLTLFSSNMNHEDPDNVGGGLFFGRKYATHVIRFENLVEDYRSVLTELGLPLDRLKLGHVGKARFRVGQNYRVLYDVEAINLIETKYSTLMKELGYKY